MKISKIILRSARGRPDDSSPPNSRGTGSPQITGIARQGARPGIDKLPGCGTVSERAHEYVTTRYFRHGGALTGPGQAEQHSKSERNSPTRVGSMIGLFRLQR